jgi:hypothetical protein
MAKAVLKNGIIYPLEPLPTDWKDGQELQVECTTCSDEFSSSATEIDRDFTVLAAMCADGDADEDARLELALEEAHRAAKNQVRPQMGLQ